MCIKAAHSVGDLHATPLNSGYSLTDDSCQLYTIHHIMYITHASRQLSVVLQGYAIGNGVTDDEVDGNAIIPFAYGKALLSTELYTELMQECQGSFWNATKGEAASVPCICCLILLPACVICNGRLVVFVCCCPLL